VSAVCVGNDVVDLEQPRTHGRAGDERFVQRVLAPAEAIEVRGAPDPDLELWCRWAAKEAGFKVISKLIGTPPRFVHRSFEVVWTAAGAGASTEHGGSGLDQPIRTGTVRYREFEALVSVALFPGTLHAVSFATREGNAGAVSVSPHLEALDSPGSAWDGALEVLRQRLTARESDAVYSRASAAVRLGARRELADVLGVAEERLEIVCAPGPTSQRPPRVLLDGGETEADVSLSHDGHWIAWVLWAGTREARA
jgi:phosphopantetheinyl transferase (holo-ACP synthase)